LAETRFKAVTATFTTPARFLSALLQTALVSFDEDRRIRVLAPIRSYVLQYHPPGLNFLTALYDHYLDFQEQLRLIGTAETRKILADIGTEVGNFEAVLRHALQNSYCPEKAITTALYIRRIRLYAPLGSTQLYSDALAAARRLGQKKLAGDCLFVAASDLSLSHPGEAKPMYDEALQLFREIGDLKGVCDCLGDLGMYFLTWPDNRHQLEEALRIAVEINNLRLQIRFNAMLGDLYQNQGTDRVRSIACYERALAVARELNSLEYVGRLVLRLGELQLSSGSVTLAIRHWEEAICIAEKVDDDELRKLGFASLGEMFLVLGDIPEAIQYLEKAVFAARRMQNSGVHICHTLPSLANAHLEASDIELAKAEYEESMHLSIAETEEGSAWARAFCIQGFGDLAFFTGDFQDALVQYKHAISIHRRSGGLLEESEGIFKLGQTQLAMDDISAAKTSFVTAAILWRKLGNRFAIPRCLNELAALLVKEGDEDTAVAVSKAILPLLEGFGSKQLVADCFARLGEGTPICAGNATRGVPMS
jgi:tetratricopeptide (TPR) repeat protein